MSATQITAPEGLPFIEITREFAAPRDVLYRTQVDPDLLCRWMGPRRMAMTVERYEPRDAGGYRFTHTAPDGGEHHFRGVFHGDPSPERGIVRTFEYEGAPDHISLERLVLTEHNGRTVLHTTAVFESVEDRDAAIASGMETGITEGYDRLDEVLVNLAPAR